MLWLIRLLTDQMTVFSQIKHTNFQLLVLSNLNFSLLFSLFLLPIFVQHHNINTTIRVFNLSYCIRIISNQEKHSNLTELDRIWFHTNLEEPALMLRWRTRVRPRSPSPSSISSLSPKFPTTFSFSLSSPSLVQALDLLILLPPVLLLLFGNWILSK